MHGTTYEIDDGRLPPSPFLQRDDSFESPQTLILPLFQTQLMGKHTLLGKQRRRAPVYMRCLSVVISSAYARSYLLLLTLLVGINGPSSIA